MKLLLIISSATLLVFSTNAIPLDNLKQDVPNIEAILLEADPNENDINHNPIEIFEIYPTTEIIEQEIIIQPKINSTTEELSTIEHDIITEKTEINQASPSITIDIIENQEYIPYQEQDIPNAGETQFIIFPMQSTNDETIIEEDVTPLEYMPIAFEDNNDEFANDNTNSPVFIEVDIDSEYYDDTNEKSEDVDVSITKDLDEFDQIHNENYEPELLEEEIVILDVPNQEATMLTISENEPEEEEELFRIFNLESDLEDSRLQDENLDIMHTSDWQTELDIDDDHSLFVPELSDGEEFEGIPFEKFDDEELVRIPLQDFDDEELEGIYSQEFDDEDELTDIQEFNNQGDFSPIQRFEQNIIPPIHEFEVIENDVPEIYIDPSSMASPFQPNQYQEIIFPTTSMSQQQIPVFPFQRPLNSDSRHHSEDIYSGIPPLINSVPNHDFDTMSDGSVFESSMIEETPIFETHSHPMDFHHEFSDYDDMIHVHDDESDYIMDPSEIDHSNLMNDESFEDPSLMDMNEPILMEPFMKNLNLHDTSKDITYDSIPFDSMAESNQHPPMSNLEFDEQPLDVPQPINSLNKSPLFFNRRPYQQINYWDRPISSPGFFNNYNNQQYQPSPFYPNNNYWNSYDNYDDSYDNTDDVIYDDYQNPDEYYNNLRRFNKKFNRFRNRFSNQFFSMGRPFFY